MIAVLQRVSSAKVTVSERTIGSINQGWLVLLGIEEKDNDEDLTYICKKIINLRGFCDDAGKMNLNIKQINGSILLVSQFTLCASLRKGNRPSFTNAAAPEKGEDFYRACQQQLQSEGVHVETGEFGANMQVQLTNEGPVTFILDSKAT